MANETEAYVCGKLGRLFCGRRYADIVFVKPAITASIENNILCVEGGESATIQNNILCVSGLSAARIENGVLTIS